MDDYKGKDESDPFQDDQVLYGSKFDGEPFWEDIKGEDNEEENDEIEDITD